MDQEKILCAIHDSQEAINGPQNPPDSPKCNWCEFNPDTYCGLTGEWLEGFDCQDDYIGQDCPLASGPVTIVWKQRK